MDWGGPYVVRIWGVWDKGLVLGLLFGIGVLIRVGLGDGSVNY